MGKIGIIIRREFNERVRKRSFIISTLLTPLLFVGIIAAVVIMSQMRSSEVKNILVVDGSGMVAQSLTGSSDVTFTVSDQSLETIKEAKSTGAHEDLYGVLVVGDDVVENPKNVQLYTYKASTITTEGAIAKEISQVIEAEKLKGYDIENLPKIMEEIKTSVSLTAFRIDDTGENKESSSGLALGVAYIFGFLIYMFVFLYGAMVMQGVIEEKSSKVLEIMVSSVKPFQLMMGKILGIALVAISQFFIWILLIFVVGSAVMYFLIGGDGGAMAAGGGIDPAMMAASGMGDIDPSMMAGIKNITDVGFLTRVLGGFIVYFIGGYLLYAAMFAAIGSAVDDVADAQQLQVPVTIPMVLALVVMMSVMHDPNSSLAVWFSIIPFTSPIIMMARIPYGGVPTWEIVTSVVVLYASFILMVWFAGKIYRVGIFMTGKKPTLKEMLKWAKYKY